MPRFSRLARRAVLPVVVLALVLAAFPGGALAQTTAQDLYNQGRDLLQQNNYQGAVDAFSRAIGIDPSMAQAYVGRATAYVYENNTQAALQDYNQALQMTPELAEALYNRGVLLAQTGDAQGAIRDLQRAAELFRDRGDQTTADLVANAIQMLQE